MRYKGCIVSNLLDRDIHFAERFLQRPPSTPGLKNAFACQTLRYPSCEVPCDVGTGDRRLHDECAELRRSAWKGVEWSPCFTLGTGSVRSLKWIVFRRRSERYKQKCTDTRVDDVQCRSQRTCTLRARPNSVSNQLQIFEGRIIRRESGSSIFAQAEPR